MWIGAGSTNNDPIGHSGLGSAAARSQNTSAPAGGHSNDRVPANSFNGRGGGGTCESLRMGARDLQINNNIQTGGTIAGDATCASSIGRSNWSFGRVNPAQQNTAANGDIGSRGPSLSFRQRRGTNSIKSDKR